MPLPFPSSPSPRSPTRRPRAFTLLELVLAAALSAIIFLGLQSVIMIASKAIPPATLAADSAAQSTALDRLALDLSYAKVISKADATGVTFTVADRNSDAADDTISYSWTGVAGDPLIRLFNGAGSETILLDVKALAVSLQTETVTGSAAYIESSETLLASYTSAVSTARSVIDTSAWISQCIPITLPAGAVDFRTTRVRLMVQASGAKSGLSAIELRTLRNGVPTTRNVASGSVDETTLTPTATWVSYPLASVRYLDPNESFGVLVRPTATPPSCEVTYQSTGAPASSGAMYTTANAGATWTTTTGRAALYELWGVYRTAGAASTTTRAKSIAVSIRASTNATIELNLPLPGRPQVTP